MSDREPEHDEGYFDPEGPGAHDHHLLDDDTEANDYVACPKCGEHILAFSERCASCGQWFTEGEAWQQEHEAGFPPWLMLVAGLVVIGLLLWLMLP